VNFLHFSPFLPCKYVDKTWITRCQKFDPGIHQRSANRIWSFQTAITRHRFSPHTLTYCPERKDDKWGA